MFEQRLIDAITYQIDSLFNQRLVLRAVGPRCIDYAPIVNGQIFKSFIALIPVRKYVAGRSNPDGELYLITYTNLHTQIILRPLWMHLFDSQGKLMNRYKIVSEDVELYYFPGIDFKKRRIFAPLIGDANIRVYYF